MGRVSNDYLLLLLSLLPSGKILSKDPNSEIYKTLSGLSYELARIDDRSINLFNEKDVQTTTELITEHETDYNLPESGFELGSTLIKRREDLLAALRTVGQQNPAYFADIAEALGYTVEIEEYQSFWVGISTVNTPVGDQQNLFFYTVRIDVSSVEEPAEVNTSKLETKLTKLKPGHSHILFGWTGVEFDRSFDMAFARIPSWDNSWGFYNGNSRLDFGREFDNSFANAYDYDGVNFIGTHHYSFNTAFDRHSGGAFKFGEFSSAFTMPA